MKILTVVGARPEFIQTAPVSRAIRARHQEVLVHTGQHYDDNMSAVFFEDLGIPKPEYHLGVSAGSHGKQTGATLEALENVMLEEKPDWVVVFGDTNSTVAAALAAAKLRIPLAHIEAGLRSFDRRMPEEVNRVVADHLSQVFFAPTKVAVENLAREGITTGVELVGDVRVDVVHQTLERARERQAEIRARASLGEDERFCLATLHRPSNTDDPERLAAVLDALGLIEFPVVLPVHPRLNKMMDQFGLAFPANVRKIAPAGFLDMMALLDACSLVVTDSGGLQKEAYMAARPAITLRDTTEWVETIEAGWNRLSEPDRESFSRALDQAMSASPAHPDLYGSPGVCDRIVDCLESHLERARALL